MRYLVITTSSLKLFIASSPCTRVDSAKWAALAPTNTRDHSSLRIACLSYTFHSQEISELRMPLAIQNECALSIWKDKG